MLNTILSWFGLRLISTVDLARLKEVTAEANTLMLYCGEMARADRESVQYDMASSRIEASLFRLKECLTWFSFSGNRLEGIKHVRNYD